MYGLGTGIEPSPDKMLQGRLFSYHDTHLHRLGANYTHIPINCPYATKVRNYQRDGPMCVDGNQGMRASAILATSNLTYSVYMYMTLVCCGTNLVSRLLPAGGAPNYYPNSFSGPVDNKAYMESRFKCPVADVTRLGVVHFNQNTLYIELSYCYTCTCTNLGSLSTHVGQHSF